MPEESQPTRTSPSGAGIPASSFLSIEEGRFPAGTTLAGRFRILGLLGKGGMGEVYRALDLTLNQPVALKFIALDARRDEAALARFRNEVRIARQVSHPNVCRVYDIGVIEGQNFLSMEYVDGEDLASLLRRIGRLPSDKALEFTRRICAGLAAAHERGVLHRDLKPANIMIDGRGRVRITDFGLAALAGDVQGGEIRSGTPAYMSPEQRAGREVTTRSDIYALGLVLHEVFTGRRPGESQATPTTLVKDLDPTIERVILRCLDADPRNRPSSALNVARALPGGDPIAAALAAGETPSPEMVAASTEKEGLQPRTAVACFVSIVLLLVALVLISDKTTLLGRAPLPLPPDALAFKAREMLKQFGYTEEPVDRAYGFFDGPIVAYRRYVRSRDIEHQWERLASHQPALTVFWYRQHQDYLEPVRFFSEGPDGVGRPVNGLVTPSDPPLTSQGMVNILLNAKGSLESLDALPSRTFSKVQAGQTVDWGSLFSAAGLDAARFSPSPPEAFVAVNADSRMAWVGTYGEGRPDTIRVEAAALDGRPVFFRVLGPWQEPESVATPAGQRFANIFLGVAPVALLVAAALVAWRNVRLGRGDQKAAWRVAAMVFACGVASWALVASHVPTTWELYLLSLGLSWSAFQAGFTGFVGISAGLVVPLLDAATFWATNDIRSSGVIDLSMSLSGARFLFGSLLTGLNLSANATVGNILVLVLLRSVVRRTWAADVLFVVLLSFLAVYSVSGPVGVLSVAATVWIIRRFGLLALAVMIFAGGPVRGMPLAAGSWYVPLSLTTPLLIAAVAAWALYVIVTSRPGTTPRLASESAM